MSYPARCGGCCEAIFAPYSGVLHRQKMTGAVSAGPRERQRTPGEAALPHFPHFPHFLPHLPSAANPHGCSLSALPHFPHLHLQG